MNKINRIIKIAGIFLLAGIIAGCDNFEDINTNPDTITRSSASMQCTGVILANLKFGGRDAQAYLVPNGLSKYIAYVNEIQMAEQYNRLTTGSFDAMTILPNIETMVEYATGTPMEDSYRGLAKFSRAFMFYRLTMRMGDIPYSETGQGIAGNYTPKYDAQKDVLIGILDELKEADAHFAKGVKFEGDPTPYAGDPAKWRRASNAFALRVLMSLSKKESDASLNVKGRFAEIVNGGNLLEESTGYLGLAYTSVNMHPLSGTNDLFTSRTLVGSLLVDEFKRLNDRRLFYYAEPARQALDEGKTGSDFEAYIGPDVSRDYTTLTAEYLTGAYSALNLRYLRDQASEPRILVSYAEQELILAEARILNWITSGTAENYYREGVKSALKAQMNTNSAYAHGMAINQEYIDNYFTGEAAFKTTPDEQLKQIRMQRYILHFMQDPEVSYFEYRRTNYPVFPINPGTNLNLNNPNSIPMRWMYPGSETNYNRDNLIEALNSQYDGSDEINKLMWILK
ncbi:MAG: SusD/RagB family nutrient-binding outer membrane lipoprotein [Tannerella sp.]|jgi:hypothetical protein|nr:SusD/RagB family nutrient-binding outer membrane lipoprotein [Tannerella sp.]